MFYSQVILARKCPLGKIWLAAHFDKKLTKNQIFSTDISDSVESVLNPSSPLALRVSGHLMLGIVRIYSRKVKYLMTDCTEAMWKIKLAFRPGNVDMLDPNLAGGSAINLAIDDARFFGNLPVESEFPELENIAFPQFLLSSYDLQKSSELGFRQVQDENDYNMTNYDMISSNEYFSSQIAASPIIYDHTIQPIVGSEERSRISSARDAHLNDSGVAGSGSRRISDVEMMRGEAYSFGYQRASHLSSVGGRASSQHMLVEDDIPAFEEQMQQDQSNLLLGDFEAPDFEDQGAMIDEQHVYEAYEGAQDLMEFQVQGEERRAMTGTDDEHGSVEERGQTEGEKMRPTRANRYKQKTKRQRVIIDEHIELSDKEIKRQLADPSSTMRRDPYDPFPAPISDLAVFKDTTYEVYPMELRVAMPSGITGMCRELQEVLLMTTNKAALPFPPKFSRSSTGTDTSAVEASQGQMGRDSTVSLEATRAVDSEFIVGHGNRVSILNTDSPSFQDSIMHDKVLEDFGPADYSYEDIPQEEQYEDIVRDNEFVNYDTIEPIPDAEKLGDYGVEESKGAPQSPTRDRESRPVAHKNSISASMALAIEQTTNKPMTIAEVRKGASTSPIKSVKEGASARTNLVYDILKDQFRKEGQASFEKISSGVSKRVAASCFLEVLQLKTWGLIDAKQEEPFGDILLLPSKIASVLA